MRTKARQKRHWIDRTKRYIGGALMILAPLGVGACSSKSDKDAVPQTDAEVQDILHREMIAIAPLDMFKVDGEEGNIPPEAIAIAPFDGLEPDKDRKSVV